MRTIVYLARALPGGAFASLLEPGHGGGFELRGGRIDRVGGRAVAVLVYARRKHVVDAFVWPAEVPVATPRDLTRDGFHLESFAAGGMRYALVSDLNRNELHDLAQLLAQDAAR